MAIAEELASKRPCSDRREFDESQGLAENNASLRRRLYCNTQFIKCSPNGRVDAQGKPSVARVSCGQSPKRLRFHFQARTLARIARLARANLPS
jgi:hypothetical protein